MVPRLSEPTSGATTLALSRIAAAPRAGQLIFSNVEWREIARAYGLSEREDQVLRLMFDDQKESVIAQGLHISNHTVHTYLGRLYRKFRVRSRCELIVTVCAHHLTTRGGRVAAG